MHTSSKKTNKKSSENKSVNKQAEAIIELYRTMPEKVQKEIKAIINEEPVEYQFPKSKETEKLSESVMDDIWLTPENNHWDDFFKKRNS